MLTLPPLQIRDRPEQLVKVSGCARLPWPMWSTFWQGHRQEKLNQVACTCIPKWSQKWSRIVVGLVSFDNLSHTFPGSIFSTTTGKLGCDTTAGSDDLAFLPVFGLHRHNYTWLGSAICDIQSLKSRAECQHWRNVAAPLLALHHMRQHVFTVCHIGFAQAVTDKTLWWRWWRLRWWWKIRSG